MKISTLFNISVFLFVALLAFGVIAKRLPPMDLLVVVSFFLAVLSTQWYLPTLCGKIAHFLIKRNRNRQAEKIAKLGIAIGKPWDGQFFRRTNLPRHMTPVMSCSNFLRIALHNQGKFAEQQILDREFLKIIENEDGTSEGRGAAKAKLAASMHKGGDTLKALALANEAINELGMARLEERPTEVGNPTFMRARERAFAAEKAHAYFIRATIKESLRKYDDALPDREKALKLSQETFGADSKEVTPHMTMLGKLYLKMKDFEKSEPHLQKSLELRLKLLVPGDKLISSAQLALSDYYREVGDLEMSEKMLAPALKKAEKNYGRSSGPGLAEYYQSIAFLRQKQGRNKEADDYFKKARATYQKFFPANHPIFYELDTRMIELLKTIGRESEIAPLQEEIARIKEIFEQA